ncbi:cytochrome c maturation protein CcmE [Aquabacterium sp. A7-Y]|uniref:cytochrome c maturation protein CcmE n=1 Tax=Aquabacterium sp. A7-Y TaxID=1349605 RepID=UPI00223DFB56|nr:cytochrome c maturation protein CcmE [Aquabacterium sp. A7-Y]MCW7538572.1 cytochrome c maturation protein CcmE [Aquabacterium sp. A7-Y]
MTRTARQRRLAIFLGIVLAVGAAAVLVLNALRSNLVFFYSPSEVQAKQVPLGRSFRVGGLVAPGSVQRNGLVVRFVVTDTVQTLPVRYRGVLPDLFREGKGVVAQGRVSEDGVFLAQEVLAKHDENYMPPEAAGTLPQPQATGAKPALVVSGKGAP